MVRKQQNQWGNIRKPQESSGSYEIRHTRLIQFLKKGGQGGGQGKEVPALQEGSGQAAKPGSVWPRNTDRLLPPMQGWAGWRSWWPGLVGICPALKNRWSRLMQQLGPGQWFFGPEEPPLAVHQASERGAPASQQPSWQFFYCFLYKTAVQFSVEMNRLGEWCELFQSWQLPFTAWHGLLYLQCSSKPHFKTVASSASLFLTVLVTSSGASLLYNNNTDWTGD